FHTAQATNTVFVPASKMTLYHLPEISETINQFLSDVEYCYVSIDMDGFAAAHALGVSAPAHAGFQPDVALECLNLLKQSGKIISLDIAETNPRFDIDNRTERLAALLAHVAVS